MVRYMTSIVYIIFLITWALGQEHSLSKPTPNNLLFTSLAVDTLAPMEMVRVFSNISFSEPTHLFHAGDGSNRIFVVEKAGRIKVVPNDYSTSSVKTFLDLSSIVNSDPSEAGMLSVAFHPDYSSNGKLYVFYTYGDLISRVSEFTVSTDPDAVAPESERKILEIQKNSVSHNGGQLAFGPDGYLYIGLGDGGDTPANGQNRGTILGKILRIDINGTSPGLDYIIPADNPLVGNSDNWREEIWAWGFRNPWRFSFDHNNGNLWVGDVGQSSWEEVDLVQGGKNYGWNIMEGFHCYNPSSGCDTTGLTMPIVEYDHPTGISITGGYVYRGSRLSRLYGYYLYGDYGTRKIWGLKYENGSVIENKIIAENPSEISSFGEDEGGEVYVVGLDGQINIFADTSGNPDQVDKSNLLDSDQPSAFYLYPAYPNPFNPSTMIKFQIPNSNFVTLEIYTLSGQKLFTLINRELEAGFHTVQFNGTGLASGVYVYRLQADNFVMTRKLVLLR